MKRGLLWICLVCVIVTSLAGCSNKPKVEKKVRIIAEEVVETAEKYLDNELTAEDAYNAYFEIYQENEDYKFLTNQDSKVMGMVSDISQDLKNLTDYDRFEPDEMPYEMDRSQKEIIEDLSEHVNTLKTELKNSR